MNGFGFYSFHKNRARDYYTWLNLVVWHWPWGFIISIILRSAKTAFSFEGWSEGQPTLCSACKDQHWISWPPRFCCHLWVPLELISWRCSRPSGLSTQHRRYITVVSLPVCVASLASTTYSSPGHILHRIDHITGMAFCHQQFVFTWRSVCKGTPELREWACPRVLK